MSISAVCMAPRKMFLTVVDTTDLKGFPNETKSRDPAILDSVLAR